MDLIWLLRVMQSDVNLRKTDRIVDYNIVFLIFCNNIINLTKKKDNYKSFYYDIF